MTRLLVVPSVLLALAATTACSKKTPEAGDPPPTGSAAVATTDGSAAGSSAGAGSATGSAATPTEPPPPPVAAGPRGLAATDNNAALVELAGAIKDCKLDAMYPANSCNPQVKAFNAALDPDKDLATVINLLEDPVPQVRFLGVRILADRMLLQKAPARTHAARILAAAKAETEVATATLFGGALLQGDFKDAAYADGIGALFATHTVPAMRASLASNLAVQDEARWLPILFERYAAETDKEVKLAILSGTYLARDAAKVCPFLLDVMKDPDNKLAGKAGYGLVWSSGKCKAHYDAFIDAYAAHLATTKADYTFVLDTSYMARADGASDEQKAKFLEAAKVVVADAEVSGGARSSMLETIATYSPDGKAYARTFLKDANATVAAAAKKVAK